MKSLTHNAVHPCVLLLFMLKFEEKYVFKKCNKIFKGALFNVNYHYFWYVGIRIEFSVWSCE